MRNESEKLQKLNVSKQKMLVQTKQRLFSKNIEVTKLQGENKKIELKFNIKLAQIMKSQNKFQVLRAGNRFAKNAKKKIELSDVRKTSLESYLGILEAYVEEVYRHVDLEHQLDHH